MARVAGMIQGDPRAAVRRCAHLVYDDRGVRSCVLCGSAYDRSEILRALERAIRDRYRLPVSPWSAAERAEDVWS